MYINKAFIFGNLTRDVELKSLPSGIQVASFSIATNRTWKDKVGAKQESVDYHNVVLFGKQAELAGQYLRKGSSLFVEGRIQTRSWDGPDGKKNYRTEIIGENMQFGPKPAAGGNGGGGGGEDGGYKGYSSTNGAPVGSTGGSSKAAPKSAPELDTIEYPEEEINPDDIPF